MVPALRTNGTQGTTWPADSTSGTPIPINRFHVAHPEADSAASINAALDRGKNLLLTPGIYTLESAIPITRPSTPSKTNEPSPPRSTFGSVSQASLAVEHGAQPRRQRFAIGQHDPARNPEGGLDGQVSVRSHPSSPQVRCPRRRHKQPRRLQCGGRRNQPLREERAAPGDQGHGPAACFWGRVWPEAAFRAGRSPAPWPGPPWTRTAADSRARPPGDETGEWGRTTRS